MNVKKIVIEVWLILLQLKFDHLKFSLISDCSIFSRRGDIFAVHSKNSILLINEIVCHSKTILE